MLYGKNYTKDTYEQRLAKIAKDHERYLEIMRRADAEERREMAR